MPRACADFIVGLLYGSVAFTFAFAFAFAFSRSLAVVCGPSRYAYDG